MKITGIDVKKGVVRLSRWIHEEQYIPVIERAMNGLFWMVVLFAIPVFIQIILLLF